MRAFIGRLAHAEPGFDVNHAALAPVHAAAVQSLSHAVGLSRAAFVARFSAHFGESPMSLLRRERMRHAADLITANALSIDQVALRHVVECKGSSA